ncbi:MAG: M28 family peptidase [Flavisolibacter sp.]
MKKILIPVLLLSTLNGFAQKKAKPDAFAKTITPQDLRIRLYIVAGPEMEGRETATEGQRKAAAYIEGQFRSMGLQPGNNGSYQLYYDVYQDSLVDAGLEVNGARFQMDRDFNASSANINATMKFSEVVFVGANAADSLKNTNLSGKVVMLIGSLPQGRGQMGGVLGTLYSKGVAAILSVANSYPRTTPAARKGNQILTSFRRNILPQQFTISENVARAIAGNDFDNAKANPTAIKIYTANITLDVQKTTITTQSSNVIAVLPGTDLKDQYMFVTAHYDHLGKRGDSVIYYGADDDGSGTVSVLEIAEAFAKAKAAGHGPRRTMVFMTVSGEEKGLWGSDYYSSHPVFPLAQTTADLNIDMIGRTDSSRKKGDSSNYVYVVGDDKLSSDLRPISETVNNKYTKMELDYKFNDPNDRNRIYYRSDHYNFAKKGVPIIFYYDGMLGADYHRPTDTPDKINYTLLAKRAQLVFYTAWEMANRNDQLKRDIPLDNNVFNRPSNP